WAGASSADPPAATPPMLHGWRPCESVSLGLSSASLASILTLSPFPVAIRGGLPTEFGVTGVGLHKKTGRIHGRLHGTRVAAACARGARGQLARAQEHGG